MSTDLNLDSLERALADIGDESWSAYGGGWKNDISLALIDAVYSIRATYRSENPGRGVLARVKAFRDAHPEAENDLTALIKVGEERLREIMGNSKTGQRHKSEAVIEAAANLVDDGVRTADDFRLSDITQLKKAYTRVHGLGWITFEYLAMLLGVPGVKADTMIVRFVNRALEEGGLPTVDTREARQLVIDAYERHRDQTDSPAETLTHFEHAIWLTESDRAAGRDEESTD